MSLSPSKSRNIVRYYNAIEALEKRGDKINLESIMEEAGMTEKTIL